MALLQAVNVSSNIIPAVDIRFDNDGLVSALNPSDIRFMEHVLTELKELIIYGQ